MLEQGLPYVESLPVRWQPVYDVALNWARLDWDTAYKQLVHLIPAAPSASSPPSLRQAGGIPKCGCRAGGTPNRCNTSREKGKKKREPTRCGPPLARYRCIAETSQQRTALAARGGSVHEVIHQTALKQYRTCLSGISYSDWRTSDV